MVRGETWPGERKANLRVSYLIRDCGSTHRVGVNALAFNETTQRLFTGGRDADIRVWNNASEGEAQCITTAPGHADWVNDIVTTPCGSVVASCSNDATVRIWRVDQETGSMSALEVLRCHSDYARCLGLAASRNILVSGGLDQQINLIDLPTGRLLGELSEGGDNDTRSIYSLAVDDNLQLVATGSPDKIIRLWDVRSGKAEFELKGHADNVRALQLSQDGTVCVSGSSDHHLRLWDLRKRSCTYQGEQHKDSVWAVTADPECRRILSAGRDGKVFYTQAATGEVQLVAEGLSPVSCVESNGDLTKLWLASNGKASVVARWGVHLGSEQHNACPEVAMDIRPSMSKCQILNDRQHVLSEDSAGHVAQWNVCTASLVQDFGKADFDSVLQDLTKLVSVPSWFMVVPSAGGLSVTLDKATAFAAEVQAAEVGLAEAEPAGEPAPPVNLGACTVKALFHNWLAGFEDCEEEQEAEGPSRVSLHGNHEELQRRKPPAIFNERMAGNTPLSVIHVATNNPLLVKTVEELDGKEPVGEVPDWVADCLTIGTLRPKESQISFFVEPLEGAALPGIKGQNQLTAPGSMSMTKVYSWVEDKLQQTKKLEGNVELFCNGKSAAASLTIGAVHDCLWQSRPNGNAPSKAQDRMIIMYNLA